MKKFIEIIKNNKEKDTDGLIDAFNEYIKFGKNAMPKDILRQLINIELKTRMIISSYNSLLIGGKNEY